MDLCQVCGNDIERGVQICPFCGGEQECTNTTAPIVGVLHKVINLELGRPLVERALKKLETELDEGRRQNVRVLTVIHGYGSSGKGGAIGVECRKMLEYLKGRGEITTFIPGEMFRAKSGPTRDLLRRFPLLAGNANLNKGNRGITVVVL
jgi:hypothetical protein